MPSSPDAQPRSSVIGAFLEGWRRVLGAPMLTLGVFVVTLATALPLTVTLRSQLEAHLGRSLEAERALGGWHAEWAADFSLGARGVGRTFTHEILGFGAALSALSRLVDAEPLHPAVAMAAAVYIGAWVFLSGGVLDRLARARPVRAAAFFAACGVYFVRFLRLGIPVAAAYWALFRWGHPLLFVTVYGRLVRDVTEGHRALAIRALLYAVFLGAVMALSLVSDFAKTRAVVEDRRSMIGAIGAAMRFIRRRPFRVAALYLLNIAAALVIARLWLQTAPAASAPTWVVLLAGQLYILFRLWAKLAFMGSEVVFFQGELAHASYTAAPAPVWPDSAAVEAIRNLSAPRTPVDGDRRPEKDDF